MTKLFLYNTLTRSKEEFIPTEPGRAGVYTCGPTVYNYAHIGNLRTYIFEDLLKRVLKYDGYEVRHVMNITDVGHLTGDMDMGEDKLEVGAKRENRSAWDIAAFYAESFRRDLVRLNILAPDVWCRATENIAEQIELISVLEKKGYTYRTADGVYFDTAKVDGYNKLSHLPLEELREGARVEKNPEKRNPTDFALWKFSPSDAKRQMEWESPWGKGFPGWHIECSAMSLKYLGKHLDIHCGGIDHINVHHTNEIAQSEAATGEKFFNYWLHGAFLNIVGGKRMGKSEGNFLTLDKAVVEAGINPLSFRFAALQVHYRKPMEYSPAILEQAESGLKSLYSQIVSLASQAEGTGKVIPAIKDEFERAINDDLNMPQALAVLFSCLKSQASASDKLATAFDFDFVFGLDLAKSAISRRSLAEADLSEEAQRLLSQRQAARQAKDWAESDRLRQALEVLGFELEDGPSGTSVYQHEAGK